MGNKKFDLPVKLIAKANKEAIERVERRLTGKQDYIKTRWNKLNKAILGGINFSTVYIIAGMMGTGKSFFRMMLQEDAFNKELNGDCQEDYLWLHFNFEMNASSEMMRLAGSKLGLSFYDLLSIDKPLDKEKFEEFKRTLEAYNDMPVFTVDHSGNVINIVATVEKVHKLHPNKKMIVSIDHSLLVEKYDEDNDNGVIAKLAAAAISIKKQYGAAVILLSQLRSSLQTPERRDPQFHYPVTDDIFGSKTLPQAADVVIMLNRPELIGITEYGPNKYSTKNLIALHITKNRDGYTALIRMKHDFEKGIIRQWEKDDEPTYSEDYQQELNI